MPHSGGGGSHGGGHHSGGHGGSRGGGSPSLSKKPFQGARRFRYYNRHGIPVYVYGRTPPKPQSVGSFVVSMLFMAPFVFAGIFLAAQIINELLPPKRLTPEYIPPETHIMDFAGLISDDEALEKTLADFEELTGVSPCVATIYDSVWINRYDSLETFAYELYVRNFDDEQHLLIVYSEPEEADQQSFVPWSWESMLGDDIYPVISDAKFDKMGRELQRYLYKDEISIAEAFERTFSESMEYVMKGGFDQDLISALGIFVLFWYFFIGLFIYIIASQFVASRRRYEEVPEDDPGQPDDPFSAPDEGRF